MVTSNVSQAPVGAAQAPDLHGKTGTLGSRSI
jgi:hypothetical protein